MRNHGLTPVIGLLVALAVGCTPSDDGADDGAGETGDSESDSDAESGSSESETGTSDDITDSSDTDSDGTDSDSTDSDSTDSDSTDSDSTDSDTTSDSTGDGDGDCPGLAVDVCNAEPASDGFTIDALAIVGDCLELDVSYSGGCREHTFTSCWDQSFAESDPVQAWLWVDHDAMGDACEALIADTWTIDLVEIKQAWQAAYQSQTGTIILHVGSESIQYDF